MNSQKGHQGFTSKYPVLGDTKHIRVPVTIASKVKVLLLLLETISQQHGADRAVEIMDSINDKLGEDI